MGEANLFDRVVPIDIEKSEKIISGILHERNRGTGYTRRQGRPQTNNRRILYALYDMGMTHASRIKIGQHRGEVMGKYHPHGDAAIYDTMVKMAQDFTMRYPLIDGHGNFGSIDGDSAAAMRYTESRMSKIALELLRDIDKETVDWRPNYDGARRNRRSYRRAYPIC